MKIAIDLDGVLADFLNAAYVIINELWPGRIPPGYRAPDWDHTDVMTKEDWSRVFDVIHNERHDWWIGVPAIQHTTLGDTSVTDLRRFIYTNRDVDVYFITARSPSLGNTTLSQSHVWLSLLGLLGENHTSVIVVKSLRDKWRVIDAIGIDFSIDDSAFAVETIMKWAGPRHRAYLLTRSWNENEKPVIRLDTETEFDRVNSMREFLNIVSEAKRGQKENQ